MAGINSRAKGAAAEREAAKAWAEAMGREDRPVLARRGQQFSGGKGSPDVVQSIPGIHLEVKRVERGNPYDWMLQAVHDAGDQIPVVMHRRNRQPWLLIMRLDDVQRFMEAASGPQAETMGRAEVPADVPVPGLSPAGSQDERASWVFRHG